MSKQDDLGNDIFLEVLGKTLKFLFILFIFIYTIKIIYDYFDSYNKGNTSSIINLDFIASVKQKEAAKDLTDYLNNLSSYTFNSYFLESQIKEITFNDKNTVVNLFLYSEILTEKELDLLVIKLDKKGNKETIKSNIINKIQNDEKIVILLKKEINLIINISSSKKGQNLLLHHIVINYNDLKEFWDVK